MKNKFLKILGLVLSFGLTISNCPCILAGSGVSKILKKEDNNNYNGFIFHPWDYLLYSDWSLEGYDAKAYFRQRNNMKEFNLFLKLHKDTIENKRSAKTLKNSEKNNLWKILPPWSSVCLPIEEHEDLPGEYLLRVDYKNKIIYTVRKSRNEYFFVFYTMLINHTKEKAGITAQSGSIILPDKNSRNLSIIKQLLLPIDYELLN